MDTFNVGDIIDGKYEITRVLGRGGMGLVVEARRPGLSTPVALKVLLPESSGTSPRSSPASRAKPAPVAPFAASTSPASSTSAYFTRRTDRPISLCNPALREIVESSKPDEPYVAVLFDKSSPDAMQIHGELGFEDGPDATAHVTDPDFDALEVALKRRDASSDRTATQRARPRTLEVRPAAPRLW